MERNAKLPRNPKKAPKRTRAVITPQLQLNVLKDYHANQMTITAICNRYSVCYETVRKILDTTEYNPDCFKSFNPGDVYQRKELDPLERLKLLTTDATQVVELSLAFMSFKLHQELKRTESNEDFAATISVKELTDFFREAAPYVLTKVGNAKDSRQASQNPRAKIHNMWKNAGNGTDVIY
jgi:hypothetical protein